MKDQIAKIWALMDSTTRRGLVLVGFFLSISTLLEMAGIGMLIPLFHVLLTPESVHRLPLLGPDLAVALRDDREQTILIFCLALAVFYAVKAVILAAIAWHEHNFIMKQQAAFSQRLLRSYLDRPYEKLLGRNSTELIRNVTLLSVRLFVKGVLPLLQLATEIVTLLGLVTMLLLIDPMVTISVGVIMAASISVFYRYLSRRMKIWGEVIISTEGGLLLWLNQSLGALKVTKLAGLENFLCSRFAVPVKERARVTALTISANGWPRLALEAMAVIALLLVLVVMLVVQKRPVAEAMTTLGILGVAAIRLIPSGNKIVGAFNFLRENVLGIDIIYKDALVEGKNAGAPSNPPQPLPFMRELRVEGVSYLYPQSGQQILDDIHLRLPAGSSLALVGRSGAGKTTLADVILGLLPPTSGSVLVDGVDIATNLRGWQSQIGYIPQDIYLLDDTLARNIALGYEDAEIDFGHLQAVMEMSRLSEFAASLPKGVHTLVGERGSRLSGGQRQRVGIARALYRRPKILVLDEATSALDSETEHDINDSIKTLAGQMTVIVIAHRLSTVRYCENIVLMDEGRIVDYGPFGQLASKNPAFARMISLGQLSLEGQNS